MRFNVVFLGPENILALRQDFMLALRHGLASCGHDVTMDWNRVDASRVNLLVGAYFLPRDSILQIAKSGLTYAVVNTEVIKDDLLNHNPAKVDFLGAYVPLIRRGAFAWDVIQDNIAEYGRYDVPARFLRWGYLPELETIAHAADKTLDYYFFGSMTARRKEMLAALDRAGFKGRHDHSSPGFIRNELIGRSKVQLNIIQKDIYTHVNSFRICLLANNRCAILSERETDPAGYLAYTRVTDAESFVADFAALVDAANWTRQAEDAHAKFRSVTMKSCMERLLDETFADKRAA
ncbi:MAG: hypothetical protein JNK67_02815 [Alphaproteobacteria bacterium]|nr:hypothetical protein [Alphaproteobacteria bacterium]